MRSCWGRSNSRKLVLQQLVQAEPVINDEHRAILNASYTASEVEKKALFSISRCKAPGTDGFDSYFYKDAWPIVGDDVIEAILDSLQGGIFSKR